ncbi:hypothetical protein [Pseudomonas yamanorum]|uniref:hypothetical protein n=1 Tax=Pseudomonas yamanorum TaxID=515393 RepID=UPI003BA08839
MTSAIESDRFNAKCELGKTYEVIEKTEETNEPSAHYEQVFTKTLKSYYLSTGESVNRLSDKHYLIIKSQKIISRKKLNYKSRSFADIKTIFDYTKNQALCIAIMLATPEITNTLTKIYNSHALNLIFISMATAVSLVLSAYNMAWLFSSLENKLKFNLIHILTALIVLLFIGSAMWLAILKAYLGTDFSILPIWPQ